MCKRGKQGNRSWCEGLAQTQGNGKLIQDRFRSSLSGSSNKFSHLPFALKSNTSPVLEWKFSYHKHQTKNINTRLSGLLCNLGPCPWGKHTHTHRVLWGTGTHPHMLRATAQALRADSVTAQSSTPGGTASLLLRAHAHRLLLHRACPAPGACLQACTLTGASMAAPAVLSNI